MKTAERKDGPLALASSFNGQAFVVEQMLEYSVEAEWTDTGSLSGSLKLQGSNDAFEPPFGNAMYQVENPSAHWVDISGSIVVVSGNSNQLYNVSSVAYRAYRIVYTASAGTGSMMVKHFAKGRI